MKLILFVGLSLFLLSGCSQKVVANKNFFSQTKTPSYKLKTKTPITLALYDAYLKWDGTPYCYGGTSQNGIDCSALVQTIYFDAFGIKIPRTTTEQAKIGYKVARNKAKEGDILLFRTGAHTHHSGIYLEFGNFINSSSKHGVTISNLNNPYWKNRYWQSRRILNY